MTARAPAALLLVLLLAGCAGPATPGATAPACTPSAATPTCVSLAATSIQLTDCVEAAFTLDLPAAVYSLPPGYTDSPAAYSPQRIPVAFDRCATAQVGGLTLHDVSLGFAAVLVNAPDRGQGTLPNDYDLETITDSPALRTLFLQAGFPVANGTLTITDQGPLRQATARGAMDYRATVEFTPAPGGSGILSDAHHSAAAWYVVDRDCGLYLGTATAQLVANAGLLARASQAGEPLTGRATQRAQCQLNVHFGGLSS
ncbi:MAG: hypothetical protein QOG31_1032 [Thermoplasmata archaeon]|jgi:hypothetical protein|nr:hypothetical protein [Thermoplasmata archaeon]